MDALSIVLLITGPALLLAVALLRDKGHMLAARLTALSFYIFFAAYSIVIGISPLVLIILLLILVALHWSLWFKRAKNKKTDSGNTDGNTD